jgi:sugar phosphate permease
MPSPAHDVAARARRRIARRLLPFLFILYVISFLDRVNVAYAALEMTRDLGFTAEVFGFGAGIFFIGYFLLEIPGALLVEKWSARKWIARIMISWGIVTILVGFVKTANQLYWARFAGPFVVGYLQTATGSFGGGMTYLMVSLLAAGLLVLRLQPGREGDATRQGVPHPTVPRS